MKKRLFINALIAAVVAAIFIFNGCGALPYSGDTPQVNTYSVTYTDDNVVLFTKQVEENSFAENVVLQNKNDREFEFWKLNGVKYNFSTPVTKNIVLSAQWAYTQHTITFVADGNNVAAVSYSQGDTSISEPKVPEKFGYTGEWSAYTLNGGNITVHAVYTPIVYTVDFLADKELVFSTTYTVENTDITEPAVPDKTGMTGKWSEYSLSGGNIKVYAIYENITYTVTFIADGITVDVCEYDAEHTTITPPSVPVKDGYTGVWETYTLECTNITVYAIYTPIPQKHFTDEQGICYELMDGTYNVTGFSGNTANIEIPETLYGLRVTAISGYAFYDYTYLTEIKLPDTIETIGVMAFGGCISLTTVTIGAGTKVISKYAFANCPSLTQLHFLAYGDWTISDGTSSDIPPTNIDNDGFALALLKTFSDKTFTKNAA